MFEESPENSKTPVLKFLLKELSKNKDFQLVCGALFHGDREISIGASLVLGHLRDKRALPYLLRALLTTDQKRAEAVMWALGEIGDEMSIPFLHDALNASFVKKSALLALGKIGSPTSVLSICKNLHDTDETIRVLAAKALSQIRFGKDLTVIGDLLPKLKAQLLIETSRRVKLMVSIMCDRLEKTIKQ